MPLNNQLILLPALTSADASSWGSAAMEYAQHYGDVHLARDPQGVDWRGYHHVSIVLPPFWSPDLILTIKQANPRAIIDRISVNTPAGLHFVLNARIARGWRYGPQTDVDWDKVWPTGKCLVGLHGRSDGELQDADYPIMARARIEAVKLTSHGGRKSVQRLREVNPQMFILMRVIQSFWDGNRPSPPVSPQNFFDYNWRDIALHYDVDPDIRYIELHNEPNLTSEGYGSSWRNGVEFGNWFLQVMDLYRARFPEAKFGFPGLSPGPELPNAERVDWRLFIEEAAFAAEQADWIGVHAYWLNQNELLDPGLGYNFDWYRSRFPDKLLFVTEFGNPVEPKHVVTEQYKFYYNTLRKRPGMGAAFAYVVSTSNAFESSRWAWRDEAGNDTGFADAIGQRVIP